MSTIEAVEELKEQEESGGEGECCYAIVRSIS